MTVNQFANFNTVILLKRNCQKDIDGLRYITLVDNYSLVVRDHLYLLISLTNDYFDVLTLFFILNNETRTISSF